MLIVLLATGKPSMLKDKNMHVGNSEFIWKKNFF